MAFSALGRRLVSKKAVMATAASWRNEPSGVLEGFVCADGTLTDEANREAVTLAFSTLFSDHPTMTSTMRRYVNEAVRYVNNVDTTADLEYLNQRAAEPDADEAPEAETPRPGF